MKYLKLYENHSDDKKLSNDDMFNKIKTILDDSFDTIHTYHNIDGGKIFNDTYTKVIFATATIIDKIVSVDTYNYDTLFLLDNKKILHLMMEEPTCIEFTISYDSYDNINGYFSAEIEGGFGFETERPNYNERSAVASNNDNFQEDFTKMIKRSYN